MYRGRTCVRCGLVALAAVISCSGWSALAAAEVIRLKNGGVLQGTIVHADEHQMTLHIPGTGRMYLTRDEILSVNGQTGAALERLLQDQRDHVTVPSGPPQASRRSPSPSIAAADGWLKRIRLRERIAAVGRGWNNMLAAFDRWAEQMRIEMGLQKKEERKAPGRAR